MLPPNQREAIPQHTPKKMPLNYSSLARMVANGSFHDECKALWQRIHHISAGSWQIVSFPELEEPQSTVSLD